MNITFIGSGIYGIALALNTSKNVERVTMITHNKELLDNFNKNRSFNPVLDKKVPENIMITNDMEKIKNTDLIIISSSSKYVRSTSNDILPYYDKKIPVCIATKGIENDTSSFSSDIVKSILKTHNISVLSGPSFATDIINNEPVALSLAATSKYAYDTTFKAFSNDRFKLRKSKDIHSVQICGTIKNVIAIASGIIEGLGYSESTRAFLITESLHDIKSLLKKLHISYTSILSFAGMGDLILTCSSVKSRNFRYGILIGKKSNEDEINNFLKSNTVEGYDALIAIKNLMNKKNIDLPIINVIYDICINKKNPEILSEFLINKE